jgi:hypothetical protein
LTGLVFEPQALLVLKNCALLSCGSVPFLRRYAPVSSESVSVSKGYAPFFFWNVEK